MFDLYCSLDMIFCILYVFVYGVAVAVAYIVALHSNLKSRKSGALLHLDMVCLLIPIALLIEFDAIARYAMHLMFIFYLLIIIYKPIIFYIFLCYYLIIHIHSISFYDTYINCKPRYYQDTCIFRTYYIYHL